MGLKWWIYKALKKDWDLWKKYLLFVLRSSKLIEHQKSAWQNEIKQCQNFEKKIKKVVDKTNSNCYTKQAVRQANASENSTEHLENYIVQRTKNKPVILRQGCWKVPKLKNEITQRIWVSVQSKWANGSERTCQRLNSRVWSWLRTNAGGVPNTCKSNGDTISVVS